MAGEYCVKETKHHAEKAGQIYPGCRQMPSVFWSGKRKTVHSQALGTAGADNGTRSATGDAWGTNKTDNVISVYLFLLKTPLSSILGFMKFGITITITFYE